MPAVLQLLATFIFKHPCVLDVLGSQMLLARCMLTRYWSVYCLIIAKCHHILTAVIQQATFPVFSPCVARPRVGARQSGVKRPCCERIRCRRVLLRFSCTGRHRVVAYMVRARVTWGRVGCLESILSLPGAGSNFTRLATLAAKLWFQGCSHVRIWWCLSMCAVGAVMPLLAQVAGRSEVRSLRAARCSCGNEMPSWAVPKGMWNREGQVPLPEAPAPRQGAVVKPRVPCLRNGTMDGFGTAGARRLPKVPLAENSGTPRAASTRRGRLADVEASQNYCCCASNSDVAASTGDRCWEHRQCQ